MIQFSTLRWKNFLSTGNSFTEIKLDKSPSTLIVGDNGAGKSTITDALCFALYGKPFRKVKKDQLINSINGRDAVVEIEFKAYQRTYKIVRGIKPNIFEIYQDGILVNQTATIKDYQEILERSILRMNFKSFTQIVILGSSAFVPFMQLPSGNRREVIEDLLDIRAFSVMSSLLKERIANNKYEININDHDIENNNRVLNYQQATLDSIQKRKKEEVEQITNRIEILKNDIANTDKFLEDLKIKLDIMKTEIGDVDSIKQRETEVKHLLQKLTTKLNNANKGVEFYNNNEHCPTCTQPIDIAVRTQKLAEKQYLVRDITKAVQELQTKQSNITVELSNALHKSNDYAATLRHQNEVVHIRTFNEREIVSLQKRITETPEDISEELKVKIDQLKIEQDILLVKKECLHEESMLNAMASIILRDGGIKSRILKQYIPIINALVNKYLAAMDFFVKFELNEQFEERILSRHRDDFTYESFSEGEKMRIDLALLFTWRAVARMKNSANTNLLILDEVFDASLDANGCDEFLKLIQSLDNVHVFVISHKSEILADKFRSMIKFEKQNNFSCICKNPV